ncbi:DNA (cytosine-5-)-methyltransferase [Agrobacterium sp. DSM 25558]|nr:DNA (cytosine-5-)-methyltransferase [Agrobacterium sp. DSM 25558]
MPTASANKTSLKTDLGAESDRLKAISESILHLRRVALNATLDLISKIAVLRQDTSIDAGTLLLRCGIGPAELRELETIERVLGEDREALRDTSLQFNALRALSKAGNEARAEVLKRMQAGEILDERAIRSADRNERARCRTDAENAYLAHRDLLRKRLQQHKNKAEKEFTDRANDLHLSMADYIGLQNKALAISRNEPPSSQERDAYAATLKQRDKIKSLAAELLVRFEDLFGEHFVGPENWLFLPEKDLPIRRLAEAHYSLKQLATGVFSHLPHHNTEFYEWSAFSSIGILAGKPAFERFSPSVVKTEVVSVPRLGRKLRAVTAGNDIAGIQLGVEAATFEIKGHLNIEEIAEPDQVSGLVKNADIFCGIVPIRSAKHSIKDKEIQVFERMRHGIENTSPRSFFLECGSPLLLPVNRGFLQKQKLEFARLGYWTSEFHLNSRDFGLCQDRKRSYVIGIKRSLRSKFEMQQIELNLAEDTEALIQAALTKDFSRGSEGSEQEKRAMGTNVDRIIHQFGVRFRQLAPDLDKLIYRPKDQVPDELRKRPLTAAQIEERKNKIRTPSVSKRYFDALQQAGLGIEFQNVASSLSAYSVPLSVSVLKVLQGLPADWVPPADLEPVREVCQTTPPVIARALAQALHQTLTNEIISLSDAAKLPLEKAQRRSSTFRIGIAQAVQPKHFIAEDWKAEWLRHH